MKRNRGVYVFGLVAKVSRYKDMLRCMQTWAGLSWSEAVGSLEQWRTPNEPGALSREEVEILFAQVKSYQHGTIAFKSAVEQCMAHDAALRAMIEQQAQGKEGA